MKPSVKIFLNSWTKAVDAHDLEGVLAHFTQDMTFYSPVIFKPSQDPEYVRLLFSFLLEIFEDFVYIDTFAKEDGLALVFRAQVGELTVEGVDLITLNDEGKAAEFKVVIRPLNVAMVLAETMRQRFASATEKA